MKKGKLFSTVTILGFMAVGAYLTSQDYSVGLSEAIAADDDTTIGSSCAETTVMAYTADMNYPLTVGAAQQNGIQHFQPVTAVLGASGNVDNEPAPPIAGGQQNYFNSGGLAGKLLLVHSAAKSKLAGGLCRTINASSLAIGAKAGAVNATTSLNVAVATTDAGMDNTWQGGNQVDASATAKVVFGAASVLAYNSPITDAGDFSGQVDGQVIFGGTNPANGGYKTQILINVQNDMADGLAEQLTAVYTPS